MWKTYKVGLLLNRSNDSAEKVVAKADKTIKSKLCIEKK